MKDIVTKKRFTKAIFSIKKNPLYIRPQRNIWFEVRCFNLLTPILKCTGHFYTLILSFLLILPLRVQYFFFQIVYT